MSVRRLFGVVVVLAICAAADGSKPLAIRVSSGVVMAGHALRVTCRVRPDARNRILLAGVEDYLEDQRQLDGERAPITWEAPLFEHMPCAAGAAYCAIVRAGGALIRVTAPIDVVGCDDGENLEAKTWIPAKVP